MSNLKDLVPPLEMCKKIPEGEFADSVFIWMEVEASATMEKTWSLMQGTPYARQRPNRKIPAPTLREILLATSPGETGVFCSHEGDGEWNIGDCEHDLYVKNGYEGKKPEELALKWWFEQKGIEND